MANEITFSGSLRYLSGLKSATMSASGHATQVGTHFISNIQDIGTVEEAVVKGDVGTIGWVMFRNLDDTNFIEVGATTGVYSLKLTAGSMFVGPWDGSTIFAKSDTDPCALQTLIVEL